MLMRLCLQLPTDSCARLSGLGAFEGCHVCVLTSVPLLYFWNRMAMASGL